MTNKELNMAILSKLYEIAEMIWQKMARNDHGCFRASEIAKNLDKIFCWGDVDKDELFQVEVDSFRCKFAAAYIFRLVTKFEGLAAIGKNAHMFTYQEEDSKERGCVCFQATKEMTELCDFVNKKHDMAAITSIFIDAEKNRLVATDSHKLLAMPVTITQKSGDTREMLINAKTWKKMCAKMKPGEVYDLVAVKLDNREEATVIEFDGMTSYEPSPCRFVDWFSCFGNIFDGYCAHVGDSWDAIRKMIRSSKGGDCAYLSGRMGEKLIQVKVGEDVATFATDEVLKHSFAQCFGREHLLAIPQLDILYLGTEAQTPKMAECKNGNIYLLCPRKDGDSYIGEKVAEKKAAPSSEKKKKLIDDSRKFAFEKIGIEPGDIITFIHGGQRVITLDNNKVVYQGKVYTLSGFCKEFMPDDRRNKANSYRGCAFFAYRGVKLDKMFKEALKAKEEKEVEKMENAKEEGKDKEEINHPSASAPAAIIKMDVADLLASPLHASVFEPVCSYFASSPIIVPLGRDKGVGARKNHYLVGVAACPMPPPVDERKFLPLQGERGAPMITQGAALG